MWVEFNLSRRHHGNVSRVRGEDPYNWAIHDRNDETIIRVMFWGTIVLGMSNYSGINWVSYRERVLRPKLYSFIDDLQRKTGMPLTYLVEANAPAHQTAQTVDAIERREGYCDVELAFQIARS